MSIRFVTTNLNKVRSLARTLEPFGIGVMQVELELPELQVLDLKTIAEYKARFAFGRIRSPLVVQDAGFFIDRWNGFPGAAVKWGIGTLGLEGILKLMEGESNRQCAFRECLTYIDQEGVRSFEAETPGTIATETRGEFNPNAETRLWRIFVPLGESLTLAEMNDSERDTWRVKRPKNYGALFADWYVGPEGPGAVTR